MGQTAYICKQFFGRSLKFPTFDFYALFKNDDPSFVPSSLKFPVSDTFKKPLTAPKNMEQSLRNVVVMDFEWQPWFEEVH